MPSRFPDAPRMGLLAPVLLALHVLEEAPGFVEWMNGLLSDGISQQLFLTVNAYGLLVTALVAAFAATARSRGAVLCLLTWLSFVMFANAFVHLVGTWVTGRYAPGTITSVLLYLPFFSLFLITAKRQFSLGAAEILASVVIGAVPMWIHGYFILFRGERLI